MNGDELGEGGSEQLLVQKTAAGDLAAFDALVRRYQLPILRLCMNMLGDPDAAQDAAQDTFFTAWRTVSRFRGEAKFSTWLYRIATNRCLKELKRRSRTGGAVPDLPSAEPDVHDQLETIEQSAAIGRAVSELSVEQRIPFLLREVDGMSYSEIAQVTGVSVSAVKSRLYRARGELAHKLGPR